MTVVTKKLTYIFLPIFTAKWSLNALKVLLQFYDVRLKFVIYLRGLVRVGSGKQYPDRSVLFRPKGINIYRE
jgi:hypothetical protein